MNDIFLNSNTVLYIHIYSKASLIRFYLYGCMYFVCSTCAYSITSLGERRRVFWCIGARFQETRAVRQNQRATRSLTRHTPAEMIKPGHTSAYLIFLIVLHSTSKQCIFLFSRHYFSCTKLMFFYICKLGKCFIGKWYRFYFVQQCNKLTS